MTDVLAGWYPDPAGGAVHRWWDGARWTESTTPMEVGAAPVYAGPVAGGNAGFSPASQHYGQPSFQPAPYHQPAYQQAGYGQPGYGLPGGQVQQSLLRRNRHSAISVGVAALYALLAFSVHVVVIGIVPVLFAVRAVRAKERFAVLAGVAAGLALLLGLLLR